MWLPSPDPTSSPSAYPPISTPFHPAPLLACTIHSSLPLTRGFPLQEPGPSIAFLVFSTFKNTPFLHARPPTSRSAAPTSLFPAPKTPPLPLFLSSVHPSNSIPFPLPQYKPASLSIPPPRLTCSLPPGRRTPILPRPIAHPTPRPRSRPSPPPPHRHPVPRGPPLPYPRPGPASGPARGRHLPVPLPGAASGWQHLSSGSLLPPRG